MKKLFISMVGVCLFMTGSFAADKVHNGFGATLTASTSPTNIVFEQPPTDSIVVNGLFANSNKWTATYSGWVLTNNAATFTNGAPATQTVVQAISSLKEGVKYRITYSVTSMTNGTVLYPSFGSHAGINSGTNGTYTQDIQQFGSSNLTFTAVVTNANGVSFSLTNVIVYATPAPAFSQYVVLSVKPTDVPIYFTFNHPDADTFTNIYAAGRCCVVDSNRAQVIDLKQSGYTIQNFWYRSASGNPTLQINAY